MCVFVEDIGNEIWIFDFFVILICIELRECYCIIVIGMNGKVLLGEEKCICKLLILFKNNEFWLFCVSKVYKWWVGWINDVKVEVVFN